MLTLAMERSGVEPVPLFMLVDIEYDNCRKARMKCVAVSVSDELLVSKTVCGFWQSLSLWLPMRLPHH